MFYSHIGNGIAKIYGGDPEGAIREYDRAIESGKRQALAYHLRANAKCCLGKYAEGILDRNKAIELDPEYRSFYNNLSNILADIDRKEIDNISIVAANNIKLVVSQLSDLKKYQSEAIVIPIAEIGRDVKFIVEKIISSSSTSDDKILKRKIWKKGIKAAAAHCMTKHERHPELPQISICHAFLKEYEIEDEPNYSAEKPSNNISKIRSEERWGKSEIQ
jgi:tetratricopeptide (TPR) repeat protein